MRLYRMMLACSSTLLGASVALAAETASTTWTAYLYQGPSIHYSVIDEVPQATQVDVAECSNDWCKVTIKGRPGYMRAEVIAKGDPAKPDAGVLAQPAAASSEQRPAGPWVKANQTGGNGGNAPTSFCLR